ncbi:hypothetical protein [Halobacillus sp. A5]|uniref:hypothetical protein n=1 Tax=Halobacillus sp. A5 TaxID=2880263 RepID=UPI0020A6726A|nr:hypothetical protein [Halobacillus sp. A5]MCP3027205.1 hypothetical protein [Halobacillus sp. A5]
MIAELYKRRMKGSLVLSIIIGVTAIAVGILAPPLSGEDWFSLSSISALSLFMLGASAASRRKYHQLLKLDIPESEESLIHLDHLVIKQDSGLLPKLMLFLKSGASVGYVKAVSVPFWAYPLSIFIRNGVTFLPLTFAMYSSRGEQKFRLKRKGIRQSIVTVEDHNGEVLGTYVQNDFKSLMTMKGKIYDRDNKLLLPVLIKGASGDFTLRDEEGRQWAHFYNGYFPHEYTKIFSDIDNDIVDINNQLENEEKHLLIAVICFLFLQRRK